MLINDDGLSSKKLIQSTSGWQTNDVLLSKNWWCPAIKREFLKY